MKALMSLTLMQMISYAIILSLLATAISHLLEAIAKARRLGPIAKDLEELEDAVRAGADPIAVRDQAESAVKNSKLCRIFRRSPRLELAGGINEQVEESLRVEFGLLEEAILSTEAAGPRFGLVLTAATIFVHFAPSAEATHGNVGGFENVGVAVVTTGAGMLVAIICAFAFQRVLLPLEDRFRAACDRNPHFCHLAERG